MRISSIIILVLISCQWLSAQVEQDDKVILIGKLVEQDSVTVVPFAFVANSQTGFGKEADERGMFKLNTSARDTLFFRSLGYQDSALVVTEQMLSDTLLWVVSKKNYEIDEVKVLMFRSYASFRHMVANMDMMPDKGYNMPIHVDIREVRRKQKEKEKTFGAGIAFGSGSTTRKERKYESFVANENRYERFREMTSRENMQYLTKLDGAELDSFMVFLRTKHKINPELSDYKMMEAINQAFEFFMAMRNDTINNKN